MGNPQSISAGAPNTKYDILKEKGLENVILKPILEYGAKLQNDNITVKKIVNETEFIVVHEELRSKMVLKKIKLDENLDKWEELPPHTNVCNLFHTFVQYEGAKPKYKFSLTEHANNEHDNMYKFINSKNLNLGINIPASYMEIVYDCIIQITMGMEHAHNHGLVHGTFGLHNISVGKEGDTLIYKLTHFTPGSSMNLPLTEKANFWPFIRGKNKQNESEKLEILMLKDIYSLGICLLELMIGRTSNNKYSISLDSLPLTWAEYAESTPLI